MFFFFFWILSDIQCIQTSFRSTEDIRLPITMSVKTYRKTWRKKFCSRFCRAKNFLSSLEVIFFSRIHLKMISYRDNKSFFHISLLYIPGFQILYSSRIHFQNRSEFYMKCCLVKNMVKHETKWKSSMLFTNNLVSQTAVLSLPLAHVYVFIICEQCR